MRSSTNDALLRGNVARPATTITPPVTLRTMSCPMRSSANDALLRGRELARPPRMRLMALVFRGPTRAGLTPGATKLSLLIFPLLLLVGLALLAHDSFAPLDQTGPIHNLLIGRDIQ